MGQLSNMLYLASIWVIPVVIAVTFHEAAHGFVARFLGDETAWKLGRVSLNPIKHIDPVGTILLPGFLLLLGSPFLFGYAKPVPVNFRALHHQCRIGCLQHVSYSATRRRTHRRRCAPGRPCRPVCPARAVRDADSHWSPLHSADVGCAIGSRSQHRLASDRKLNRLRHSHHTAIDRQHMTACNHYSNWRERC